MDTMKPSPTRILAQLPATIPFIAPEALERASGRPFELRLGANESAFGPSPLALEAMREAVEKVAYYADPECYLLREGLAHAFGIEMERIVVASGIDDLLGLIVRGYLEPGSAAVTSLGAYPTFNFHVDGFGGRLERIAYRNYRNDLPALAEVANRSSARMLYLANPDNPMGTYFTDGELRAFLAQLPPSCLLLLDEAYGEFAPPEAMPPLTWRDPRLIRLRTFSKAYGMAGARVGYAVGEPEVIAAFEKIRLHFGVNLMAQAGALVSIGDTAFLQSVVDAVAAGRDDYAQLARELDLMPIPSATNFVSIEVGSAARARALVAALAERGVFIRMPGVAPLDRCVRVTVGTPPMRARFADHFRAAWAEVRERVKE